MLVPILERDLDDAELAVLAVGRTQAAEMLVVGSADQLLRLLRHREAAAVVADAALLGGVAGVAALSRESGVPLVVLDGTGDGLPRLMEAGADYVLAKPFPPGVLGATVQAVLRRQRVERVARGRTLAVGPLTVEPAGRSVRIEGRRAFLSPREADLLEYLALNAGVALSPRQIIEGAWGGDPEATPAAVTMCVHRLRRKLERSPRRPVLLRTRRNVGYVLLAAPQPPGRPGPPVAAPDG